MTQINNQDTKFNGLLDARSATSQLYKAGSINDADVGATAALASTKLQHRHKIGTNFDLAIGATPVAREEVIHIMTGTGTLKSAAAMLNDSGTSTDVDFDVKINGVSALSAAINVVHGTGDRTQVDGTLSTTALADGDVISGDLAVTSSTGAQGPYLQIEIDTAAA